MKKQISENGQPAVRTKGSYLRLYSAQSGTTELKHEAPQQRPRTSQFWKSFKINTCVLSHEYHGVSPINSCELIYHSQVDVLVHSRANSYVKRLHYHSNMEELAPLDHSNNTSRLNANINSI